MDMSTPGSGQRSIGRRRSPNLPFPQQEYTSQLPKQEERKGDSSYDSGVWSQGGGTDDDNDTWRPTSATAGNDGAATRQDTNRDAAHFGTRHPSILGALRRIPANPQPPLTSNRPLARPRDRRWRVVVDDPPELMNGSSGQQLQALSLPVVLHRRPQSIQRNLQNTRRGRRGMQNGSDSGVPSLPPL